MLAAEHGRARNDMEELAHVAGPIVRRRNPWHPRKPRAQVSHGGPARRGGNVAAAFAQGRRLNLEDGQSIIEVLAQRRTFGARSYGLVGRGEHPGAGGHPPGPPDALEGAVLKDAQELGLEERVEVANLVEEQRAAAGCFEAAGAAGGSPGEGSALVTEELALEERRRGRAARLTATNGSDARTEYS